MDYLTVKEVAELSGYTIQYIRKLVRNKKIKAEQRPHPQNNKMCYMIPVPELPEEIQLKYYNILKAEMNLGNLLYRKHRYGQQAWKQASRICTNSQSH